MGHGDVGKPVQKHSNKKRHSDDLGNHAEQLDLQARPRRVDEKGVGESTAVHPQRLGQHGLDVREAVKRVVSFKKEKKTIIWMMVMMK